MKVTFKGNEVNTVSNLLPIGSTLNFKAVNLDLSTYSSEESKNIKVLSLFPSIDTSVCEEQTKNIVEMAQKYPQIEFISVSEDLPFAQKRWCAANSFDNINIISDYKDRELGTKSGWLVKEIGLLLRGYIVLDENNQIIENIYDLEITNTPKLDVLESTIKTLI